MDLYNTAHEPELLRVYDEECRRGIMHTAEYAQRMEGIRERLKWEYEACRNAPVSQLLHCNQ